MLSERRLWREPSFDLMGKIFRINWLYVLLLCALAGVGYTALYSAAGGSPEPYANRHVLRFAFGLVLMLGIGMIDIRFIARLAWPLWALCVGLLVLVLRMGHVGKGAQRWLDLGGLQLQPSEMMKLALILALAAWFHRASWERMGNPLFLIPPLLATLIPVGLILKEPNLGTAAITGALGGALFFGAGVRWWKFILVLAPMPFLGSFVYHHMHDYQRARIDTFLHPESDPLGAGYNIIQSKIALGSGGMWGKGFLQGTQGHLDFLPEKQTDFIFTMIGEEFGLVGAVCVIGLLCLIILGGMLIGMRCRNQFGRLVAFGISCNFFLYVFANIAMVMGAIPVGGVPLPLVSHGGSAMLTVMAGFGVLMSVHVHRDVEFPAREPS
ncbi:rod shape-determining protein RodA [Rhodopila sp.]|jgi:rod shape determining protein RodA|uniref:rod shape-determining protein RodA n=1 Tax=Rhodopila sp. TaxID=2480087 RepID=UPI002B6E29DB|nr:rod shape-determining protein RodA [Rhodopila sp.]HVZ07174.1 rod shape-determining protein RodA [Rhodopila sp.]